MKQRLPALSLAAALGLAGPALAQGTRSEPSPSPSDDAPAVARSLDEDAAVKVAGSDVPVPKRVKFVPPTYPPEALARGVRGIVIVDVVIDELGKVASVKVARSVPPFDAAAMEAVRQWEYEVTKVDGHPVRVRHTFPISFALKLPEVARAEGVPELRQGANPVLPQASDPTRAGRAQATVVIDEAGEVRDAAITDGDAPWADALLLAIRTWRFVDAPGRSPLAFQVEASFEPGTSEKPGRVNVRLYDPKPGELPSEVAAAESPAPPSPRPVGEPAAAEAAAPAPPVAADAPAAPPSPAPAAAPEPPPPAAAPSAPQEEVVTRRQASAPPAPTAPEGPGVSSVEGVALAPGVPDLAKGRRPTVPPLARMERVTGVVKVKFAVDTAGAVNVQEVDGPDLLVDAARATVSSWSFRRTSIERIYALAELTYGASTANATVKLQE